MKTNLKLRKEIFKIIENQIENNDPPETIKTFDKLKSQGYNDFEVKQLIGQCVAVEIYNVKDVEQIGQMWIEEKVIKFTAPANGLITIVF